MLFVALSCLQGRPMARAFDELAALGAGIQLTPGNFPTAAFRDHVAASGVVTRDRCRDPRAPRSPARREPGALDRPARRGDPAGCAHVERGFLACADVYAADERAVAAVRGAAAWGTVETARIAPGSRDMIDPAMVALRDLGPLGLDGVAQLAAAARPWPIERLHALVDRIGPGEVADELAHTTTLPRLRRLVLGLADATWIDHVRGDLVAAPWWPALVELTVLVREPGPIAAWPGYRDLTAWFAVALAGDDRHPAGWQVAFGPDRAVEISMVGWHPHGTLPRLAQLVRELPDDTRTITLVSSPYRVCHGDDAAYVRDHAGRAIIVA